MSEQDRVRALLDEGKISQEEAEELLEALGDKDEAEVDVAGEVAREEGAKDERVGEPPSPPPPPPPTGAASPHAASPDGRGPDGLHWVRVVMFAGNLEVRVDGSLERPTTEGEVTLTQEEQNYVVRQVRNGSVLTTPLGPRRNVEVTLPAGYGLDLDLKGGNVDLYDVPFLKGKLLAGNLDAKTLGGIHLDMKAGNLDASLRLTEGEHRLDLKAGNGELRLLPGSSVAVSGEVKAGGVETKNGLFTFERGLTGGSFRGTVGEGRASLTISQTAGNLELAVQDAS